MIRFTPPAPGQLRHFNESIGRRQLNYEVGLLDRGTAGQTPFANPRHGWFVDRCSTTVGHGQADFEAACAALRDWKQFPSDWIVVERPPVRIREGNDVTYAASVLGVWWTYGCRIVRVIDEPRRFGFVYGTIDGHAECGEELFLVELADDGAGNESDVMFSLFAMSRPGRWFTWPGMPLARRAQRRFRIDSAAGMTAAVHGSRINPKTATVKSPPRYAR